ncbi:MAG TPA: ACT domain-containing protein [Acidimicrobiales bacterium]
MTHLAVSAIGADRPGIVAAVTGALVDRGANLEDTSMSILRGHFAMMLVVAVPADVNAADVEASITAATAGLDLVVVVRAIDDGVPPSPGGEDWTVSVYGADRPGIVHRVTSVLAGEGVNVVDLTTRVIGDEDRPVYAMFLDVTVPAACDGAALVDRLQELAGELGVSCSAHPAEPDIL